MQDPPLRDEDYTNICNGEEHVLAEDYPKDAFPQPPLEKATGGEAKKPEPKSKLNISTPCGNF
jgi:hypothetical protein